MSNALKTVSSKPVGNWLDSFLGFDHLFGELDRQLTLANQGISGSSSFPPYNIIKEEKGYSIELAVAGFKKSDITIQHDKKNGTLTIQGAVVNEAEGRTFIRQGVAMRKFTRSFTLSEDIEVEGAKLEDGMLTISLVKVEREGEKPVLIPLK
jgi:molecular chaperone IbpA